MFDASVNRESYVRGRLGSFVCLGGCNALVSLISFFCTPLHGGLGSTVYWGGFCGFWITAASETHCKEWAIGRSIGSSTCYSKL